MTEKNLIADVSGKPTAESAAKPEIDATSAESPSPSPDARFRGLPAIDALLKQDELRALAETLGRELLTFAAREAIEQARASIRASAACPSREQIAAHIREIAFSVAEPSLKAVVNATGILIHTNLGRVPLGKTVMDDLVKVVSGYCNLEFDLTSGERGHRNAHLSRILAFVTGAEDALVVNNNAAALILALNTLANGKEVVISRGELIEIGGSFRIPEILAASGAIMVEVGTTNKTRLADYQKAITPRTAIILKAHKSNFAISGFTEEARVTQLAALAKQHNLVSIYDIGSGLLRKPERLPLTDEPDVRSSLSAGVDLVTFSGDKLLGGPQSGIVAGRSAIIAQLARAPMMRALRVGKLTIAALSSAVRSYLTDDALAANSPLFQMLASGPELQKQRAETLASMLHRSGIEVQVVQSQGQCGGGTLPGLFIPSYAVVLVAPKGSRRSGSQFAERIYRGLLTASQPVVAILRQGEVAFDVLTVADHELEVIRSTVMALSPTGSVP